MNKCPVCQRECGPLLAIYVDGDLFDDEERDVSTIAVRWTLCGGCLDAIETLLERRSPKADIG